MRTAQHHRTRSKAGNVNARACRGESRGRIEVRATLVMADEPEEELAERLFAKWAGGKGTSKSQLERETWGDGKSHGRRFDRFVRERLGVSTARPSKQTDRIQDLEQRVRSLGSHPIGGFAVVIVVIPGSPRKSTPTPKCISLRESRADRSSTSPPSLGERRFARADSE